MYGLVLTDFPHSRLESFACIYSYIQTVAFYVKAMCIRERDHEHFGGSAWPSETSEVSHFRRDWHSLRL